MITVKIIKVPGAIQELALEDGATLSDALAVANLIVEDGQSITVNGNPVPLTTPLNDSDRIIITKGAKGA